MTTEQMVAELFSPFLGRGFSYEYTYEKNSDRSCVYIHRFRKGADFFDLRSVTGGDKMSFVVYAKGAYKFPNLSMRYKKQCRAFAFRHLLKRATEEENLRFLASLLSEELDGQDFFGIAL